jgi:transposase
MAKERAMIPRLVRLHWRTRERLNDLRKKAERDGAYRVARRLHAVVLNSEGHTSGEVARLLRSARSKVSLWLANFQTHGVDGLLEGHRCGRPAHLTQVQCQPLADIVESGPVAYGFDCGVWTSPRIARVMEEEFGICYHPGPVRKLLHQIGFSVQRPRRVLARADPVKQDRWQRYDYPRLKKKPNAKSGR